MRHRHFALFLSGLFVLSACGGGGTNSSPPTALPAVTNSNGANPNNPQQSAVAPKFTVVDLGAAIFPRAINSLGEIVGWTGTNYFTTKAFSYSNGTMHSYGTLPGDTFSAALDVNDSGEIVGDSGGGSPVAEHAVIITTSSLVDLGGLPGAVYNSAGAVNNAGEIVGDSTTNGGPGCDGNPLYSFGVKFDGHGGATVLNGNGGVNALNNAGVTVGDLCVDGLNILPWASTSVAFPPNACIQGIHFDLSATDVNDAGDVIGEYAAGQASQNPPSCTFHGFLVKNNHSNDIPGPGGKTTDDTNANGLNSNDWVVGADSTLGHAILYINGTVYDLNSLLVGAGCALWTLQSATDINNSDVIVGTGLLGGTEHGFMLVPQH